MSAPWKTALDQKRAFYGELWYNTGQLSNSIRFADASKIAVTLYLFGNKQ